MSEDSQNFDESFSLSPNDEGDFNDDIDTEEAVSDKVRDLKKKLAKALAEKDEYLLGWQRERADFANFKKEIEERNGRVREIAQEKIIDDIIPVLDSFTMAFANKEAWESVDRNWRGGVEYIHQQLTSALSSYGLEAFTDIGKPFDPARHVIARTEIVSDSEEDHIVLSVIQNGYVLQGRVIRPARVVIGVMKDAH